MIFKEKDLRSVSRENAKTEIMFEIASARADNVELIRINIADSKDGQRSDLKRLEASVVQLLKAMKQRGQIQLFALPECFIKMNTEAVYLINKYPAIFKNIPSEEECESYIYIKL